MANERTTNIMNHENDTDFEDVTIDAVEQYPSGGWSITRSDGWIFSVPADSPVSPTVGITARFYGKGIGSVVRGLFLNGQEVFYRTPEEQREYSDIQLYGKDAAEWVARWDEGKSIFSIEMGGLGPGYEQAIQILAVEVVRHMLELKADWWSGEKEANDAQWKRVRESCDAVVTKLDKAMGFSGAQVGAAIGLAAHIYRKGPLVVFNDEAVKDRHIQVSKEFPSLTPTT